METIQLEHKYTVVECYPSILFESIELYNECLKSHTKDETDEYIKHWIHNRVIECIEKDLEEGIIKELPEDWKENYTKYLNKNKESEDINNMKNNFTKPQKYMSELESIFKKITKDDMTLEIIFQEHDEKLAGSEDEITLFIKDNKTKEHRGINLTYYFEKWNCESKLEEE